MNTQNSKPIAAEAIAETRVASVVLTVDYSNGTTTTVGRVALDDEGGLWATIAEPSLERRNPQVTMAEGFIDRGSNHRTHIEAIDGVSIDPGATCWSIWVNERSVGTEIRYHMAGMPGDGRPEPAVNDGDAVLIKLVAVEVES